MAKTDTLIDYLTDIADAIREKEGSTDPINAQDFSEKIRNMPTAGGGEGGSGGGSGEGGGSNIFVKMPSPDAVIVGFTSGLPVALLASIDPTTNTRQYIPAALVFSSTSTNIEIIKNSTAFAVLKTENAFVVDKQMSIVDYSEFLNAYAYIIGKESGETIPPEYFASFFTEITEEEFYNLNA